MYFQGDIGFIPLSAFDSKLKINRTTPIRTTEKRLLIQEGEITGHHHGIWFVPQPTMYHDGALARSMEVAQPAKTAATLYADPELLAKLEKTGFIEQGAPVIGFLAADEAVTIRHASEEGKATGEHDPIKLTKGEYLVIGKREWSAGDQRRVQD